MGLLPVDWKPTVLLLPQYSLAPAGAEGRPCTPGDGAPYGRCSPPPSPHSHCPPHCLTEHSAPHTLPKAQTPKPTSTTFPALGGGWGPKAKLYHPQKALLGAPVHSTPPQHLIIRGLPACQMREPQDPTWDPGCSLNSGLHGRSRGQTPSSAPGMSGRPSPAPGKEAMGALATPSGNEENEDWRRALPSTPSSRVCMI